MKVIVSRRDFPLLFIYLFFVFPTNILTCGIAKSKKTILNTLCYQYALQLLSKGVIPIIFVLPLFDSKFLLSIAIIIGLLFVCLYILLV